MVAQVLINNGIFIGFCAGAMLLLRPIFCRMFTAQQRVVLWFSCVGWYYLEHHITNGYRDLFPSLQLPLYLRDLIVNQTWLNSVNDYKKRGPYYIDLSEVPYLDNVYVVFLCLIFLWVLYRSLQINQLKSLGVYIPKDDPWIKSANTEPDAINHVYVVEGLSTSFVDCWNNIFLQTTYAPERMYHIFLHEAEHIRLRHTYFKLVFSVLLLLYWWNPLLWLSFRYMVQDMELACDSAVLAQLKPEERTEYAKTLVELGCGRQLWTQPLCFGECDAEIRVKAALKWKKQNILVRLVRYGLMAAIIWFYLG